MNDDDGGYREGGLMSGMTIGLPKPSRVVKALLIINAVVFLVQIFADQGTPQYPYGRLSSTLGVTAGAWWQVWRYVTFQFLHADAWHIVLNMLGVYFFGTALEQRLGSQRFLTFYLSCGIVAGLAYVVIARLYPQFPPDLPIIGASGGVYGILLAAAVFFPHFRIIFIFFPVPIRMAALIIFGIMILTVLQALAGGQVYNAMSDVAHLGGAVTAAFWIWALPRLGAATHEAREKISEGAWEKKLEKRRREQQEIDRILAKISQQGINSLTAREKRFLQQATRRQQKDDNQITRL